MKVRISTFFVTTPRPNMASPPSFPSRVFIDRRQTRPRPVRAGATLPRSRRPAGLFAIDAKFSSVRLWGSRRFQHLFDAAPGLDRCSTVLVSRHPRPAPYLTAPGL